MPIAQYQDRLVLNRAKHINQNNYYDKTHFTLTWQTNENYAEKLLIQHGSHGVLRLSQDCIIHMRFFN